MRIVIDANVIISGLINNTSLSGQIIALWRLGIFDVLVSTQTHEELDRILSYTKFQKNIPKEDRQELMMLFDTKGILVDSKIKVELVIEDPTDNKYIELAIAGSAKYLVTGDQFILKYEKYQGIEFVTPARFVAQIQELETL